MIITILLSVILGKAGCAMLPAADVADSALVYLIGEGWHGDPADQQEALYSPSCLAIFD